jgi:hypothetical protein
MVHQFLDGAPVSQWCTSFSMVHQFLNNGAPVSQWCTSFSMVQQFLNGAPVSK